jgi:hypothetical protein
MTKRYVKNASLDEVYLPGVGRITNGRVLMGDEYGRFSPRYLTEVPEHPQGLPLESTQPRRGPSLLTEPTNSPAVPMPSPELPKLEEELLSGAEAVPAMVKRPRGRPRKYPLPT